MFKNQCLKLLLLCTLITPVHAMVIPAVPTEPIYFEPPVVTATEEQQQLNCVQLDTAIRKLQPYQYSYKPSFFYDDANKLAVVAITIDNTVLDGMLGFGYLAYSALVEEKEQRRVLSVGQYIAALQDLKAEKQCFERR